MCLFSNLSSSGCPSERTMLRSGGNAELLDTTASALLYSMFWLTPKQSSFHARPSLSGGKRGARVLAWSGNRLRTRRIYWRHSEKQEAQRLCQVGSGRSLTGQGAKSGSRWFVFGERGFVLILNQQILLLNLMKIHKVVLY